MSKFPYSLKKRLNWSKFTALINFELRYSTRDVTIPQTNQPAWTGPAFLDENALRIKAIYSSFKQLRSMDRELQTR